MRDYRHKLPMSTLAPAAGLMLALAATAQAQGQGDQGARGAPPATQQQETIDVSKQQLETFVEAQENLVEVRREWRGKMQSAEGQEAKQQARSNAQEAMVSAVKDSGLSVDEYNKIARAVQSDPELQKQVREMRGGAEQQQQN